MLLIGEAPKPENLYAIAEKTRNAAELDEIVDWAIESGYTGKNVEQEKHLYMNRVCINPALSKESIIKLIEYDKCEDIHGFLTARPDIDYLLIELMAWNYTDFSIVVELMKRENIVPAIADIIVERVMHGDIRFKNCCKYENKSLTSIKEEIEGGITRIAHKCSYISCCNCTRTKFLVWWRDNKAQIFSDI